MLNKHFSDSELEILFKLLKQEYSDRINLELRRQRCKHVFVERYFEYCDEAELVCKHCGIYKSEVEEETI